MTGAAFLSVVPGTTHVRIFVSYDREHDADLLDRLVEDAHDGATT